MRTSNVQAVKYFTNLILSALLFNIFSSQSLFAFSYQLVYHWYIKVEWYFCQDIPFQVLSNLYAITSLKSIYLYYYPLDAIPKPPAGGAPYVTETGFRDRHLIVELIVINSSNNLSSIRKITSMYGRYYDFSHQTIGYLDRYDLFIIHNYYGYLFYAILKKILFFTDQQGR